MSWLTDRCHKERVINCQQAPWPEDDVTSLRPLYTFVWSTFIKVRTADPAWLLHNISVYKSRPWKIKNWDQFLRRLVSPCRSLSHFGWVSIWSAEPAMLTNFAWASKIWPGRLHVSSPSGEQKDACGLVQTSCLEVLLVSHINQVTQPLFSTEFSYWAILILLLFISLINI